MIYDLHKANSEGTLLRPTNTMYSEEYAERMCPLYLTDSIERDSSGSKRFYRLHALRYHTIEDALAYDIDCPKCGRRMKQVGRSLNAHDLGLYTCKHCNEH